MSSGSGDFDLKRTRRTSASAVATVPLKLSRIILRNICDRPVLFWWARRADAFLVSFPKSGRTWLRYILSYYFAGIAGIAGQNGAPDLHSMFAFVPNFDLDRARGIPAFRTHYAVGRVPAVFVSHNIYSRLFLDRPIIFMVRDPRDVVVSAYFHATLHKGRFSGSMSDFFEDHKYGVPAMLSYLNGWADALSRRRHHILSYETLSADPIGEVKSVLLFLGCTVDETLLRDAVNAGEFEKMRGLEMAQGLPAHEYNRDNTESMRMRKGVVGGFRDYLNDEQIARIEGLCFRYLTPAAQKLVMETGLDSSHPSHS